VKDDQVNPEYAALVESVDESVGQILQAIKDIGQEDNTLVIFTSDNGGYTTDPKCTSNYPLMGGKSFPFEAGMKVPMIIKWPKMIEPGITAERSVGTDIYPTLLATAGLDLMPEQHVDGVNLMPLLTKQSALPERPIVFHYPHYTHATGPFSSIIEEDWKLIRFYNDETGAFLLYNLADDPEEQNNLAATVPERRDVLANRLEVLLKEMQVEMPTKNPDFEYSESKKGSYNLESTKSLAEKERRMFEKRLDKIN
jgi:arylsulfatase A-like enzyme